MPWWRLRGRAGGPEPPARSLEEYAADDLSLPGNIRILTLPPYSPELNPAEHLWDLIRERRFANKAYDTLDDVEDELADELHTLERDQATIQSLTNRTWITSLNLTAT